MECEPESAIPTENSPNVDFMEEDSPFIIRSPPEPLFDPNNRDEWFKMVRFLAWRLISLIIFLRVQVGRRVSVRWGDSERSK